MLHPTEGKLGEGGYTATRWLAVVYNHVSAST